MYVNVKSFSFFFFFLFFFCENIHNLQLYMYVFSRPVAQLLNHTMLRKMVFQSLKGIRSHAILGNFSTDHMVIELTKISK